jgi:outer membrane protein
MIRTFPDLSGRVRTPGGILPANIFRSSMRLVIGCVLCVIGAVETRAEAKIGTVDMDRVLKEYNKSKEGEVKVKEAMKAAQKELDDRVEAHKKTLEEINKLNAQLETPVLSTDAKAAKAKERDEKIATIKNMEREISDFRQTREQQLQQQVLRLREGLVKEITDVVMERGKSKNLDLVFDKSGAIPNRISPILFSPDNMDFTTEVIAELNKKKNGTTSSTPAKPEGK